MILADSAIDGFRGARDAVVGTPAMTGPLDTLCRVQPTADVRRSFRPFDVAPGASCVQPERREMPG